MFKSRTLGREETLLRYPADSEPNLTVYPGEWYKAGPQFPDENWRVDSLRLMIAGPSLLASLKDLGAASAALEIGVDENDGYGGIRDSSSSSMISSETATEWNSGTYAGIILDKAAGFAENGNPRVGIRGDVLQASLGTVTWTSAVIPLRYGSSVTGLTWEADLLRDDTGSVVGGDKITLEARVRLPSGLFTWTDVIVAQTPAELEAGTKNLALPRACNAIRIHVDLAFRQVGQAAHRQIATLRTSAIFMAGAWIVLDSPNLTIRSLADLIMRSDADRELIPNGYDGSWDLMLLRVGLGADLIGRSSEGLKARIVQPGAQIKFLEIQAVTDVWFEET